MNLQDFKLITLCLTSISLINSGHPMIRALNISATGMATQETNVNTISNNIANINTVGFKKARAESQDLMYQTLIEPGARSSNNSLYNVGLQIGSGSKISAVRRQFTPGSPRVTNNPFDLMIEGRGFFGIMMPNGNIQFTRDGSFNLDSQGQLVNKSGLKVFPGITVPPGTGSVNISFTGDVDAYLNGQNEPQNLGAIPVFTFINDPGLKGTGKNLFRATAASGPPQQKVPGADEAGQLHQGALENSNVNIMNEMTGLIKAQRAYEMNSKVMSVADEMLKTTNNLR